MTATHLVYLNINKMTRDMNMIKKNESKFKKDDLVYNTRTKTVGKGKVAVNSRAEKMLPA